MRSPKIALSLLLWVLVDRIERGGYPVRATEWVDRAFEDYEQLYESVRCAAVEGRHPQWELARLGGIRRGVLKWLRTPPSGAELRAAREHIRKELDWSHRRAAPPDYKLPKGRGKFVRPKGGAVDRGFTGNPHTRSYSQRDTSPEYTCA